MGKHTRRDRNIRKLKNCKPDILSFEDVIKKKKELWDSLQNLNLYSIPITYLYQSPLYINFPEGISVLDLHKPVVTTNHNGYSFSE